MTREELKEYKYWLVRRKNIEGKIEKQCTRCENWFEENRNNFYMTNKSKPELGFSASCIVCIRKSSVDYRHRDIEKTREKDSEYYHNHKDLCHERMDSYRGRHHSEIKQKEKIWQQTHPDKLKEYNLKHRNHDISEKEWKSCLSIFKNRCAYCGLPVEKHIVKLKGKYIIMNLHKDHVDYDGYNTLRNAIPACRDCNSSKSQDDMEEWYKQQEFFNEDRLKLIKWWISEGYKDYIEDKPPYRTIKEKNEDNNRFHWNLWSVDEKRNMLEIISTKDKKKDLAEDIKEYLLYLKELEPIEGGK